MIVGRSQLLLLVLMVTTGCTKSDERIPVHAVKGSVFYENRPASGAVIQLHPVVPLPAGTPQPRARVQADGSFVLTTFVTGDGAPAGEYAVTVTWKQPMDHPEQEGPDLLPARFGDPKLSGIKATVAARDNELQAIRLSRKP